MEGFCLLDLQGGLERRPAPPLGGEIWRDREDLAWSDPFQKEVWDYNIDVAVEAARNGFDEIQFDYLRFPDEPGLVFSKPNNETERRKGWKQRFLGSQLFLLRTSDPLFVDSPARLIPRCYPKHSAIFRQF